MAGTMVWPDDVTEEARKAVDRFFTDLPRRSADDALMLSYAYGYMEAHDEIRREKVFERLFRSLDQRFTPPHEKG